MIFRHPHNTPERAEEERRYKEYLSSFSIGDEVRFVSSYGFGSVAVAKLTFARQTATQLVFRTERGQEKRFRKSDGHEVGGEYSHLPYPASKEELDQAEANIIMQSAAWRFGKLAKGSLTLEEAEQIDAILKAAEERTKALEKGRT